ncbi:hypothetical protein [Streptomyces sp. SCSIO ZS0520]|nr:hypothetical protein [Streptomyces sp. SCSIO ZS0520]
MTGARAALRHFRRTYGFGGVFMIFAPLTGIAAVLYYAMSTH